MWSNHKPWLQSFTCVHKTPAHKTPAPKRAGQNKQQQIQQHTCFAWPVGANANPKPGQFFFLFFFCDEIS
jgi:hypothetical protein